jgi:NAD(P)H-hydrate epimerase
MIKSNINSHLTSLEIVRQVIAKPHPDIHKGQRGKLLIVGGSTYFHGAGQLSAIAAYETMIRLGTYTNDMVMFCSTPANLKYLKNKIPEFIGVPRNQFINNLHKYDVILIGPGMMRETNEIIKYAKNEPEITKKMTLLALSANKKLVLDAGSLQVIEPKILTNKTNVIITPHRGEMVNLFGNSLNDFFVSQKADSEKIKTVAELVWKISSKYKITILLKGPVDIIANQTNWFFSPGGDPGMATGGSGDVLAGLVAALYCRTDNPLIAAATASYILKRTGEYTARQHYGHDFYTALEIANNIRNILEQIST